MMKVKRRAAAGSITCVQGRNELKGADAPEEGSCMCRDDSSKLVAGGVGILVVVGAVYAFLNSQF